MRKLQVLLESKIYKDIYVPEDFTKDEISSHIAQVFGSGSWHKYSEYESIEQEDSK